MCNRERKILFNVEEVSSKVNNSNQLDKKIDFENLNNIQKYVKELDFNRVNQQLNFQETNAKQQVIKSKYAADQDDILNEIHEEQISNLTTGVINKINAFFQMFASSGHF